MSRRHTFYYILEDERYDEVSKFFHPEGNICKIKKEQSVHSFLLLAKGYF